MSDSPTLDLAGDDQRVLAQIVGYYHATLKGNDEAQDYLRRRGVSNAEAIDRFNLGFADRSLGRQLPSNRLVAGRAVRQRLQRLRVMRESGHEHMRGSITVPVLAADGTGRVVDMYGGKVRHDLRPGTPLHSHLDDQRPGIWNIEAFANAEEIILCPGLFDALVLWSCGYRNATCMFSRDTLPPDMVPAFVEFGIKRVLTPCETVTQQLLDAGLEAFLLRLPLHLDINSLACSVSDPADVLGCLLRAAEWVGRGKPTQRIVVPVALPEVEDEADIGQEEDAEEDDAEDQAEPRHEPVVRLASPVLPLPAEDEAQVGEDEVAMLFGTRRYRVRGLAKNTSLDVLRVNILASNDVGLFIDTLDLYAAKHRQAFVRQASEEMGVDEVVVKRDLGRLLLKLEQVQDERLEALLKPTQAQPDMKAEDRTAALELLRSSDLLDRIVADCPVVGERANILVAYLAAVSRKLDMPLAVLIQSTSAAGKSTLMDGVLAMLPPEDVVRYSAMTGQSLYYMADSSLKHKVLAIAEEQGAQKAGYALKLLQSDGELRIASTAKDSGTGRLTTHEYRVEGPVSLFLTTTSISVDEELLNRCMVLSVDEDRQQTRLIHDLQRRRQTLAGQLAARDREARLKLHRDAQRLLRPLMVVNPFAERLRFMDNQTRTRRDNQKYLTLIRAIALLRQHQRPVQTTEHGGQVVEYISVTLEDIETANRLAGDVLGRSLDELPPQTRNLLGLIDDMVTQACQRDGIDTAEYRFSRRQLRQCIGWGDTQLKVHLRRLVELEYLLVHRDRDSRQHRYELLCHGTAQAEGRALPGLADVEELRRAEWAGQDEDRAGQGRILDGVGSA